jgi:arylsulfatase
MACLMAVMMLGATLVQVFPAEAQDKKPNVVFFLVDNTGWGDWGSYGGTIPTPRLDELAKDGLRFTNYNVEVQCTPTRSAIHTG